MGDCGVEEVDVEATKATSRYVLLEAEVLATNRAYRG